MLLFPPVFTQQELSTALCLTDLLFSKGSAMNK